MKKPDYTVILFYKFKKITNPEKFRDKHKKIAATFGLTGRLLVAPEGINGTFEGTTKNIKAYIKAVRKDTVFKDIVFKDSEGNGKAFTKLMVKTRPEVVTLGLGKFNVKKDTAPVITAAQLDKMYQRNEDFVVLDMRNDYEIQAGYFEKTVNPGLRNFSDLPGKLKEIEHLKDKKVVAVCTGKIRCEKGTCLLKKEGFKNLHTLENGIWSYMKKYPGKRFKGSLFVFDNRIITDVVPIKNKEVVAKCFYCATPCEIFYNDDSIRPSKKVVCCDKCIMRHPKLRKCVPV